MIKVKTNDYIWGLVFKRNVRLLFRGHLPGLTDVVKKNNESDQWSLQRNERHKRIKEEVIAYDVVFGS